MPSKVRATKTKIIMRQPTFIVRSVPAFPRKPRLIGLPHAGQRSAWLLHLFLHSGQVNIAIENCSSPNVKSSVAGRPRKQASNRQLYSPSRAQPVNCSNWLAAGQPRQEPILLGDNLVFFAVTLPQHLLRSTIGQLLQKLQQVGKVNVIPDSDLLQPQEG